MKKLLTLLLIVCLLFSFGCSSQQTNDSGLIKDGVFTIAMECSYSPYNWAQADDSNGAVKIKDSEVIVRQGRLCLTVKRLGSPGHPLQAPVGGAMTRTIHEHPSCKVYYRFTDGDVTLLELEAPNAAFEYEYWGC